MKMKLNAHIFLLILTVFLCNGLFAQRPVPRVDSSNFAIKNSVKKSLLLAPEKKGSWVIGLVGGPLFGRVDLNGQSYSLKNKQTFQSGLSIGYGISDDVRIQLEMLFERRAFSMERFINGFRLTDTSEHICWDCYYAFDVAYVSDYFQLPLLIHYSKDKGPFSLAAEAGVYYALLIVNNYKGYEEMYLDPDGADSFIPFGFEPGLSKVVYSGPTTNQINTYDAGIVLGIAGGYQLTSNLSLMLNGRLQLGFSSIYENPQMPVLNFTSYILRFGLYYQFSKQ